MRGGQVLAEERLDRREAGGQGVDDRDLVGELLATTDATRSSFEAKWP